MAWARGLVDVSAASQSKARRSKLLASLRSFFHRLSADLRSIVPASIIAPPDDGPFDIPLSGAPYLAVAPSPLHGLGLFARRSIDAGSPVIIARGRLLPASGEYPAELERYCWIPRSENVDVGPMWMLDQYDVRGSNGARYLNSSRPAPGNVAFHWVAGMKVAVVVAVRRIHANEELLVPYDC